MYSLDFFFSSHSIFPLCSTQHVLLPIQCMNQGCQGVIYNRFVFPRIMRDSERETTVVKGNYNVEENYNVEGNYLARQKISLKFDPTTDCQ